ncbi:MAG: hypothetical protein NTZ13_03625 [Candidatus Parcubacteria bacterium]|nr:hypothetical protein [Candidatus Parcubacteria bacterium]
MHHIKSFIVYFVTGIISLFVVALPAYAGTLNLITDKTQFAIGDEFSVDVKIDSEGVGINAAQASINFPVGVLQEKETDKTNSVFSFWLQEPTVDNSAGEVLFIGGSSSGLTGKTLQALRITFKVVGSGPAEISFSNGAITAADGNGTNVLSAMKGLNITSITKQEASRVIPAPKVPPVQIIKRIAVPTGKIPAKPALNIPLYPSSDQWYDSLSPFIVQWSLPSDVTGVATALDQQPVFDLKNSEGLFDNKTFPSLSDGVWYLHVRFKNDVGWGPVTDYKIGIDTAPPLAFDVVSHEGNSTYVVTPTISFETKDQPSGIDFYRILVDGDQATSTILTKYTLSALSSGNHIVSVIAEDKAGNKTSTNITIKIRENAFFSVGTLTMTQSQFFVILVLVLIAIFGGWWYSYRRWENQLERRIVVAERDVGDTFNIISEDAEKIIDVAKVNHVSAKGLNEIGFLAKKISEKASKTKKYIIDNIRELSQR